MSEPITRSEMYLAALNGEAVTPPAPITRIEQYLYKLCQNGNGGGGGNTGGGEVKKAIVNDVIFDTGNLVVSTDTLQIDTGVSVASLSQYDMFGIAFVNVNSPWTSLQPKMFVVGQTVNWILCENGGGNIAILRRLVPGVDYFEVIRGAANSANNSPIPPAAGHAYSVQLTKTSYSDCRDLDDRTIKVSWPTQTEERTFRVLIFGMVKREE